MSADLGPAFCSACEKYLRRRKDVVVPHIVRHALATDELARLVFLRFMAGVHRRHLAGLPLSAPTATGAQP